MLNYYWPIILIVVANVGYHVIAKSTPAEINPLASLIVTYGVSAALATIAYFVTSPVKNLSTEYAHLNWTAFAFGVALICLELGSIYMYRSGWNISIGATVANISLALVLIVIGIAFYKEAISFTQVMGIGLCIGGLILINK